MTHKPQSNYKPIKIEDYLEGEQEIYLKTADTSIEHAHLQASVAAIFNPPVAVGLEAPQVCKQLEHFKKFLQSLKNPKAKGFALYYGLFNAATRGNLPAVKLLLLDNDYAVLPRNFAPNYIQNIDSAVFGDESDLIEEPDLVIEETRRFTHVNWRVSTRERVSAKSLIEHMLYTGQEAILQYCLDEKLLELPHSRAQIDRCIQAGLEGIRHARQGAAQVREASSAHERALVQLLRVLLVRQAEATKLSLQALSHETWPNLEATIERIGQAIAHPLRAPAQFELSQYQEAGQLSLARLHASEIPVEAISANCQNIFAINEASAGEKVSYRMTQAKACKTYIASLEGSLNKGYASYVALTLAACRGNLLCLKELVASPRLNLSAPLDEPLIDHTVSGSARPFQLKSGISLMKHLLFHGQAKVLNYLMVNKLLTPPTSSEEVQSCIDFASMGQRVWPSEGSELEHLNMPYDVYQSDALNYVLKAVQARDASLCQAACTHYLRRANKTQAPCLDVVRRMASPAPLLAQFKQSCATDSKRTSVFDQTLAFLLKRRPWAK